jgi:hypothetical protein
MLVAQNMHGHSLYLGSALLISKDFLYFIYYEKADFTIESGESEHSFKFMFNINDLAGSVRILFLQEAATLKIKGDATVPVKLCGQWKVSSITVSYEYYEEISS